MQEKIEVSTYIKWINFSFKRCKGNEVLKLQTDFVVYADVPIIKKLNPQVIDEGQALRVRCDVESEPPAKISWFSPDRRLIKTGQHLVMEKMSQSDAGSYLCKAQNTFYNDIPQIASMEVKVFVRCKLSPSLSLSLF